MLAVKYYVTFINQQEVKNMSRIGKAPITLPAGVELKVSNGNVVTVKGPKGELHQTVDADIKVSVENNEILVTRPTDQKRHKAMHGLYRALISNMVTGVTAGYKVQQELVGVGYKAANDGNVLDLTLGYSHHIYFEIPKEIKVKTEQEKGKNPIITLESADKQLIGQVAAKIRSLRKPEPYKGKGIKFVGEQLRRKAGKTASK
jgi:large subunit ribosomal protein L6